MTRKELEAAGFVYADYLPQGTRYGAGDLYVLLSGRKTVRVYLPAASDVVEIATGDLFSPVKDVEELVRFAQGALL